MSTSEYASWRQREKISLDLLGCEAIVEGEKLNLVYEVVTNCIECHFLKNTNQTIELDISSVISTAGIPTYDSVKMIAQKLYHMLKDHPAENADM